MVDNDTKKSPKLVTLKVTPEDRAWFMHLKADMAKPIYQIVSEIVAEQKSRRQALAEMDTIRERANV